MFVVCSSEVTYNGEIYKVIDVSEGIRHRNYQEIQTIALHQLGEKRKAGHQAPTRSSLTCVPSSRIIRNGVQLKGKEAFYICSSPAGSVIVATDILMNPILGFSDTPIANFDSLPDGLSYLLDLYAKEYEFISNSGDIKALLKQSNKLPHKAAAVTKGPLITTQWGQGEPYNNTCPTSGSTHCVTGCVATAMAQIMNYYRYPNDGTFDWDNMKDDYSSSYTTDQADAVAKLMRACGAAVSMSYGTSASSAYDEKVSKAFVSSFGYLGSIAWVERSKTCTESWNELMMSEIDNQHPVYYSGRTSNNSNSTGHAFIVDGYQKNGDNTLFHVNYGWDGNCDGYYSLGNLQGYNYSQGAYVNIKTGVESLSNDGGVFQAGDLYMSTSELTTGKQSRLSLTLTDATFCRYTDITDGKLYAYFVSESTSEKYYISRWNYTKAAGESGNFVMRNKAYTPSMPAGMYYVRFYTNKGNGNFVPVTTSNNPKVQVVSSESTLAYIDLGLPSRTLWASKNVGAKSPYDVGLYFAWAETDGTKSQYTEETYKYYSNGEYTKYNSTDKLTKLESGDDAATANWGENWVTPTYSQIKELVDNCTWVYEGEYVVNYNGNKTYHQPGYRVTGPNGNKIFIPECGVQGSSYQGQDDSGYWTSTISSSTVSGARMLSFSNSGTGASYSKYGYREWGRPIRPVYAIPNISVSGITLSKSSLQMTDGEVATIVATVSPSNAFNKEVRWSSSNTEVATVEDGVITAKNAGEAVITATACDGSGVSSQCRVTVKLHEEKELVYTDGYGSWTSSVKYDGCYETKTYSLYAEKGDVLSFDWTTSSEYGRDELWVLLDGSVILRESGERSGSHSVTIETDGTHQLVASWSKDDSDSSGNDEVSVKNICVNHYRTLYYKSEKNELGSWTSTNHDDGSSGNKTFQFSSDEGDVLTFNYNISSEESYDKGYVYLDGSILLTVSGLEQSSFSYTLQEGSHSLKCEYVKDESESESYDRFTVSDISVSYKNIAQSSGMTKALLSSGQESIHVYKEFDVPCSYVVEANDMKWQSVILPFGLSYADWCDKVEIAEIDHLGTTLSQDGTAISDVNLFAKIIDGGTIQPNTPYLIRTLQNNSVTLSNENATLKNCSEELHNFYDGNIAASIYPIYTRQYSNGFWVDGDKLSMTSSRMNIFHWRMTLTDKDTGSSIDFSNDIGIVMLNNVIIGDANADSDIDVADIRCIANHILGKTNATFDTQAADANGDGSIDVGDIRTIANIILRGTASAREKKESMIEPQ